MSDNDDDVKEPKPSCCTRFKTSCSNAGRFMYNPDTKEVMGRSGTSWLKITIFYVGFYAILAGFWAACMVGFIRTLDPIAPTMQKMMSMMKDNPGMNYQPFPSDASSTLITFSKNSSSYSTYVQQLTDIFTMINESNTNTHLKPCSMSDPATLDRSCQFNLSMLGSSCTPENDFGYSSGMPCVLLRINRVFLWQPTNVTFDSDGNCKQAADQNSADCKNQIEFDEIPSPLKSSIEPGYISVSCEGENDGDADNINGVTFYPDGGFPVYFFPYYNQDGYISPIVMAQFNVVPGRVSLILCEIWTRDVIHDQIDLQGSIHFELFYDAGGKTPE